ncbi:hypothetical protein F4774DRAFT_396533 [Daldinia eschscholtzii]|nr:hypothetical protein F4774DRAFT_396533 [Daldinia eschscholtzii]
MIKRRIIANKPTIFYVVEPEMTSSSFLCDLCLRRYHVLFPRGGEGSFFFFLLQLVFPTFRHFIPGCSQHLAVGVPLFHLFFVFYSFFSNPNLSHWKIIIK